MARKGLRDQHQPYRHGQYRHDDEYGLGPLPANSASLPLPGRINTTHRRDASANPRSVDSSRKQARLKRITSAYHAPDIVARMRHSVLSVTYLNKPPAMRELCARVGPKQPQVDLDRSRSLQPIPRLTAMANQAA